MNRRLLVLASLLSCLSLACGQNIPSSDAALTAPESIKPLMLKTFRWQIADQSQKKSDGGWIRAVFYTGVTAAYRATNDSVYLNNAVDWAKTQGKWAPHAGNWRFADNYCNAQVYTEIFELKHDPEMLKASRANFDRILASPKPGRVDWWWCDALYMGPPAFVRMSAVTGDPKYANFSDSLYWDAVDFLYRPEQQLFFRDSKYFNQKTKNGQPVFWSRGNGWVHAGLARLLQYLPADHPSRPKYVTLFKDLSAKLITLQQTDGLWRPSLLDQTEFNDPETSGTAFFTFGLAWGINHQLLDRDTYLPHVIRGYAGLCALIDDDGKLTHVQTVAQKPGKVVETDTQEYAVGAFLQVSAELLQLKPTEKEEADAMKTFVQPIPSPTTQSLAKSGR